MAGVGKEAKIGCCAVEGFLGIFLGLFIVAILTGGEIEQPTSATTASETTAKISTDILNRIIANKATYQAAASKAGLSWQMLAAVHYREGSCNPDHSGPSGEAPGTVNPDSHKVECTTFEECEAARARHLISLAAGVYKVKLTATSPEEDIKNSFLAYNRGYMYKKGGCTFDQSPYVMNQFDAQHLNMRWPNNSCEPSSTRGKINVPNGAFTVYSYLINNNI